MGESPTWEVARLMLNLAVMMLLSSSNSVHLKSSNTVSVTITILLEGQTGQAHNILYIWPLNGRTKVFLSSPVENNKN